MLKNKIKKLLGYGSALAVLSLTSSSSFAAGLADVGNIDMSDGKAAITAVAVALAGFLVVGLAARYVLGFFKRA